MIRAWTPPFTAMVRDWWVSASRVERRHFGRTLVPKTLMAKFKSHPWDSKEHFRSSLKHALACSRESLNETIFDTFAPMRATPVVGCPTARVEVLTQVNQWAGDFGTFSTTRKILEDAPPTYSPPAPLPLKVTRKRAPGPRIEPFCASDKALSFVEPPAHPPRLGSTLKLAGMPSQNQGLGQG